jgi:nucleotide-binding universal stress UspA family protein
MSSELAKRAMEMVAADTAERRRAEEALLRDFAGAAANAGISADHHVEGISRPSDVAEHLIRYARTADLIVLGKTEADDNITHDVLFAAGVPIIVVPSSAMGAIGRRIVIAWNGSAESARAVRDALPILEKADSVTVLCIDGAQAGANIRPGEDVARHLGFHGIEAALLNTDRARRSVGEALLAQADDLHADMLVMGAYGHSRLREFVLGGVTKRVLAQADLPVMMSH